MRPSIAGFTALAALAALLGGCGAKPGARVDGAWVRLPAVAGRPGAAYFTLKAGDAPVTLVALKTPAAARVELHESMGDHSGTMTMTPLSSVAVPAGGSVRFAPGGKHAMLFDIAPGTTAGSETVLTLTLSDGRTLDAKAAVRGAGDAAP